MQIKNGQGAHARSSYGWKWLPFPCWSKL